MKKITLLFLSLFVTLGCHSQTKKEEKNKLSQQAMKEEFIKKIIPKSKENYNTLSPDEAEVIIHKGTERPYSGKYYKFDGVGIYVCKRCEAPLYRSEDKFNAHCGWPSFDDEIPGAIKRIVDTSHGMVRTEILCAHCEAHLGHVFEGEGFTPKNLRHCVNSTSLKFISIEALHAPKVEKAYFAGGCFWGVEYYFAKQKGVLETRVGYTGGHVSNPSYEQVCSKNTGHAEVLEVSFDPEQTNFKNLCKLFFEIHDPTQLNRQGPDIGEQYRSEIFFTNENQKQIAQDLIDILKNKGYNVVTKLSPFQVFWNAEEYHQLYYEKTGKTPYCHKYTKRFD